MSFLKNIQEIRDRARQQIENGAVTKDYTLDREQAISILNEALATELVCVLRYKFHYFMAGPFSFRKEIANQAPNELKDFVPRGASLRRHAPMTQNPFMKADTHDTTASSAHRSFL